MIVAYRSKRTVTAVRYTGDNLQELRDFAADWEGVVVIGESESGPYLAGGGIMMHIEVGDWIVREQSYPGSGSFYILCKGDVFDSQYERMEETPA